MSKIISICGPISSGKTSLVREVAALLSWEAHVEPSNPFANGFITDPSRWAFHSQLHHLMVSYRDTKQNHHDRIIDGGIHDMVHITAQAQRSMSFISEAEYALLRYYYKELNPKWPSLVIVIDMPPKISISRVLSHQVPEETCLLKDRTIGMEYMAKIYQLYKSWTVPTRLVVVDHNDIDRRVTSNPAEKIVEIIKTELKKSSTDKTRKSRQPIRRK
jgi:deoxyadenosine/deoxycytidine kinase